MLSHADFDTYCQGSKNFHIAWLHSLFHQKNFFFSWNNCRTVLLYISHSALSFWQRKHFSACRNVGRLRGMVQGHLKFCGLTWNKNMQALHICVRGSSPDKTLPSGKFQFFESTIQIGYTLACLHLENIWLDVQLYMYFLRAGTVLAIRLCKCVDNECCL